MDLFLLITQYAGWGLLSFFVLWVLFVQVMFLKKHEDKIEKYKIIYYPLAVFVALGFLYDVAFNIVFGTILFLKPADFSTANTQVDLLGFRLRLPTLSERLSDILAGRLPEVKAHSIRWHMAKWICHYLIEPWDYNHCGLENLKEIQKKVFKA